MRDKTNPHKNANKDVFITHNSISELKKDDFLTIKSNRRLPRIFVPILTEEYKLFRYKTPRSETVSQFLGKTRQIVRNKYVNAIQRDKYKHI